MADAGELDGAMPAWSAADTDTLLRLPVALALAWIGPENTWERIATGIARRRLARRTHAAESPARRLAATIGDLLPPAEIARAQEQQATAKILRQVQFLRCHRPGGWFPEARLVGREHLQGALAGGRGAILWVAPFAFASLVAKLALHQHGVAVCHLSRWFHGVSRSRWGVALLNPIQRRAEDLYLKERITIARGQLPLAAMRRLRERLTRNETVSITVGHLAAGTVRVPFLKGELELATGPMRLAAATGAPILPVFTIREEAGGGKHAFTTTIERPLPKQERGGGEAPQRRTAGEMADRLARWALAYPGQLMWADGVVVPPHGAGHHGDAAET
jgi:lauroyl/myristoyl acyltransferase